MQCITARQHSDAILQLLWHFNIGVALGGIDVTPGIQRGVREQGVETDAEQVRLLGI